MPNLQNSIFLLWHLLKRANIIISVFCSIIFTENQMFILVNFLLIWLIISIFTALFIGKFFYLGSLKDKHLVEKKRPINKY